jgi:hypothetical protein
MQIGSPLLIFIYLLHPIRDRVEKCSVRIFEIRRSASIVFMPQCKTLLPRSGWEVCSHAECGNKVLSPQDATALRGIVDPLACRCRWAG